MNYIHEFTLKLIHDEHVQSLQNIPEVIDENTIHQQDWMLSNKNLKSSSWFFSTYNKWYFPITRARLQMQKLPSATYSINGKLLNLELI